MGIKCYLCGLANDKLNKIALHKFPDPVKRCNLYKLWLEVCCLDERDNLKYIRICSRHFKESDMLTDYGLAKIKAEAIPVINVPNPEAAKNVKSESSFSIKNEPQQFKGTKRPTENAYKDQTSSSPKLIDSQQGEETGKSSENLPEKPDSGSSKFFELPLADKEIQQPTRNSFKELDSDSSKLFEIQTFKEVEKYTKSLYKEPDSGSLIHRGDLQTIRTTSDLLSVAQELSRTSKDIDINYLQHIDDLDRYFGNLYQNVKKGRKYATISLPFNNTVGSSTETKSIKTLGKITLHQENAAVTVGQTLEKPETLVKLEKEPMPLQDGLSLKTSHAHKLPKRKLDDHFEEILTEEDTENFPQQKRRTFEPRYVQEIQLSDVATPSRASRVIKLVKKMDQTKSAKIKNLQKQRGRLKNKINNLNDLLYHLKNEGLMSADAEEKFLSITYMNKTKERNETQDEFCSVYIKEEYKEDEQNLPEIENQEENEDLNNETKHSDAETDSESELDYNKKIVKKESTIPEQHSNISEVILKKLKCNQCEYSCDFKGHLIRHKLKHSNERPFKCNQCENSYKHKFNLVNHKLTHTSELPFKCDQCECSFIKKYYLIRHKYKHTKERPFKCDQCEFSCIEKHLLINHKLTHGNARPFKCDQCEYSCNYKISLVHHKYKHTKERPFKCDKCKYSCNRKQSLANHELTHGNELPFKCDQCKRSFMNKKSLVNHKLTHTNKLPFKCDQCECSFKKKHYLVKHQYEHTNERPFKCDQCKYSCNHKLTDGNERPFKCDQCEYTCNYKRSLVNHKFKHTNERPFKCNQCEYSCNQKQSLVKHKSKHTYE